METCKSQKCFLILEIPVTTERPPSCTPSPCGPHSRCQLLASGPACSCLPGYVGSPPYCRPECTINSECPAELACVRQKCEDPCPGSCGIDANCHVLNHVAVCICNDGFTGDPFSRCLPIVANGMFFYLYIFTHKFVCSIKIQTV